MKRVKRKFNAYLHQYILFLYFFWTHITILSMLALNSILNEQLMAHLLGTYWLQGLIITGLTAFALTQYTATRPTGHWIRKIIPLNRRHDYRQ
ncbi:MAG: hypothetical protein A2854_02105 [Parcubacteria group bacterium RIFCSPHIGHO2_01_FULL_56_18]|nr:MAG: hypothetical protein A2854_02105 [Parcubacteria group bacterium RIFCSPHIGHO2_01_FULL_56_18]